MSNIKIREYGRRWGLQRDILGPLVGLVRVPFFLPYNFRYVEVDAQRWQEGETTNNRIGITAVIYESCSYKQLEDNFEDDDD